MDLRPYQTEAIGQIRDSFSKGKRRVILCLPTGAGKTVVFAEMVRRALLKDATRVLILTDRIELITQAGGTLGRLGIEFGTIQAGRKITPFLRCHVGMVETFIRRGSKDLALAKRYNLVIIDEAHKGNFKKALRLLSEDCYVIGATATPLATSKADPLKNYYNQIVCPIAIPDLVDEGFLVPARTFSAAIDRSSLRTKLGEYTDESQMKMFDKRVVYDGVINKWREFGERRKTICFNVNVEHSLKMTQEFNDAGIRAVHLDGSTPAEERRRILLDFKYGQYDVLCNVGIVTAGYDEPSVSCIIVNRVTQSVPLWLQMCGRGSRLYPGKNDFIILDMGENYRYLGLWESDRDWEDIFNNPKKPGEGIAPTKQCEECCSIVAASLKKCPYCQSVFPEKERDPEEDRDVDFQEVTDEARPRDLAFISKPPRSSWRTLPVSDIAALVKAEVYRSGWAVRVIKDRNTEENGLKDELTSFASEMGYKRGWVNYQLQA